MVPGAAGPGDQYGMDGQRNDPVWGRIMAAAPISRQPWREAVKSALVAFALFATSAAWVPALAQRKGEEIVKDGVPHVLNPEQPVEEISYTPKELWILGGDDDEILFGLVSQLVLDKEGNVYVLDGQLSQVQVFSPAGEHLRTLGREGEGPGEFRNATDLYMGPGGVLGVVQVFPGKIVQLRTDGTPADNFPLPEAPGGGFQLVFVGRGAADRVVLAGAQQRQQEGKMMQVSYLKAFDKSGKELVRFHEEASETRFGGMKFEEKSFSNFQRRWALAPDGRVAAALDFDKYTLTVWNPDGTVNRVIERPQYAPVPRSDKSKKRFQKLYDSITRWNPGSTFEVSPTHVAVDQVLFREDGSLWVLSGRGMYEKHDPKRFAAYDVYDPQGRFARRVSLMLDGDAEEDGLFFAGDRLYKVTDLFGALMANFGGGTAEGSETVEAAPVTLVAYQLDTVVAGKK